MNFQEVAWMTSHFSGVAIEMLFLGQIMLNINVVKKATKLGSRSKNVVLDFELKKRLSTLFLNR